MRERRAPQIEHHSDTVVKTYKNLFPRVWAFDNLYWAHRAARRAKRDRPAVAALSLAAARVLQQPCVRRLFYGLRRSCRRSP